MTEHFTDEETLLTCDNKFNVILELSNKQDVTKKGQRVQALLKLLCSRQFLESLFLGQFVSILLCGTGVFSGLLQNEGVNVPAAQSFLVYYALGLVFTTQLAFNQTERNLLKLLKSTEIFKYLLIGIIEVEANFMVVKAYSYTSVTSVQILDCFSIAAVLLLSRLWLHTLYRWCHYLGVTISVVGLGVLVAADVITGKNKDEGSDIALGDSLVIIGAILYGFNNVAQEYVVKNYNKSEYLGMVGLFSTVVSGIQVIILEREELSNINFVSYKVALPWFGYFLFLFLIYTCMSWVIQKTSATVTNLSLLTADFYALIIGIFIFGYSFHALYVIAFFVVLFGVAVYSFQPTESA
ncbi:solute carrier family 35 member F2 [Biomphalaria pfeifferi]|uniref:Solute carrier family 35 member F2 n=1 Tax=Biomphalaria pfeifferi TaxID=112525 RepID=A0AAD8FAH4_BIOPF|nr:solute carrier family 35 member F2 [Biomphalaria pfeifferi]